MEEIVPLTVLAEWRRSEGLNKAQAAARVGKARATWLRWEKGSRKIGVSSLPRVQRATGIPLEKLRPDLASAEIVAA